MEHLVGAVWGEEGVVGNERKDDLAGTERTAEGRMEVEEIVKTVSDLGDIV